MVQEASAGSLVVPQIDPSVPQPVFQSQRRPLLTLTNSPVLYDFYVGDPISRLLMVGSTPSGSVDEHELV